MGRSVTLGNGRDIDRDIELCRTTNEKTSEQTIHVLMENHIPFTKSWINIPFFSQKISWCKPDLCDQHQS